MRLAGLEDLKRLVELHVEESSVVEYKSELPLQSRTERRELLKDLTGMGNGGGGSVIFGIDEDSETSAAVGFTPLPSPFVVGQIESIVQSAVRPPLIWSHQTFEVNGGYVVVAEVERSPLGPYMVDAYNDKRYHKHVGRQVHIMSESEVRDAYEIASRARERRDDVWKKHLLPMGVLGEQPWLLVSALPDEPLNEIFDSRKIDLSKFLSPPELVNYRSHTSLSFAAGRMRHWADGLTAEDGLNGTSPTLAIRLHRDGAAGIATLLRTELVTDWILRIVNAYLIYLAWFWNEFSLTQAVEIEVGIVGLKFATLPRNQFGTASLELVEPPGVTVNTVSIKSYELPWELKRAAVRHRLLRRFADRIEQSFGRGGATSLFDRGWLYDQDGKCVNLILEQGGIVKKGTHGPVRVALIDTSGTVIAANPEPKLFVDGGVILDNEGNALATLEMPTGPGCPKDFVLRIQDVQETLGVVVIEAPTGDGNIPVATGEWSDLKTS